MKTITIAGNIGKSAELRTTQKGDAVAGFSVAVEDRASKDAPPFWFDVAVWGKRGETLAQYLTKGTKVVVSGELTRREHEGKTYLGVRANEVTLMGGGKRDDDRGGYDQSPVQGGGYAGGGDLEDQIPFAPEWRV